jgi:hypothetical protein
MSSSIAVASGSGMKDGEVSATDITGVKVAVNKGVRTDKASSSSDAGTDTAAGSSDANPT